MLHSTILVLASIIFNVADSKGMQSIFNMCVQTSIILLMIVQLPLNSMVTFDVDLALTRKGLLYIASHGQTAFFSLPLSRENKGSGSNPTLVSSN